MAGVQRTSSSSPTASDAASATSRLNSSASFNGHAGAMDSHTEVQLLRQALASAPVLMFTTDRHLQIVHANPPLQDLAVQAGFNRVVGAHIFDVMRPADRGRWEARYADALAGHPVQLQECTEVGGREYTFQVSLFPVRDAEERVIGLAGHLLDVTAQVQAQADLAVMHGRTGHAEHRAAEAEMTLHAVLDSSTDHVLVIDRDLRLRYANRLYRETMSLEPADLGRPVADFHDPQDVALWQPCWLRGLAGEAFTIEQTTAFAGSLRTFHTSYFPVRDPQGEVIALGITTRDISEIKRKEAALADMALELAEANEELLRQEEELRQQVEHLSLVQRDLAEANEELTRQEEELREQVDHLMAVRRELAEANEELTRQEEELRQQVDYMAELQAEIGRQRDELADLTNTIPATIYRFETWDDGTINLPFMSKGVEEVFGCSQAEMMADYSGTIRRLVHPEDWLAHEAAIAQAVGTTSPFVWEGRIVTPQGEQKWVRSVGRPLRDDVRPLTHWYGVIVDITQQKQYEADLAIQQAELDAMAEELRQLTDNVPGLMFRYDWLQPGQGRFGLISHGAEELLGLTADALATNPAALREVLHPADWFGYQRAVVKALHSCSALVWEGRLRGETDRWIRMTSTPRFFDHSGCWSWFGTIQDITRQKQYEAELAQQQAYSQRLAHEQRQLIDNVPGMIYRIDQLVPEPGAQHVGHLSIGFISEGARAVLGYEAEDISASYEVLISVLAPDDQRRYEEQVQANLRDHTPFAFEGKVQLPDGSRRWIRINSRPVWDAANQCHSWYGLVQDITQQQEYAMELQQKTEELAAQQEELRAHLEALTQAETELRRSEGRLSKLLERIPAGVLVLDGNHQSTFANQRARQLLLPAEADHDAQDAGLHAKAFAPLIYNAESPVQAAFEGRTAHLDGMILPELVRDGVPVQLGVTASPVYSDTGRLESVVVVVQDVTQRKQSEKRLRQTQQQLEAVLATYPNILVAVGRDGRYNLSRGRGLERLGLNPNILLGQHYRAFNAETPEIADDYDRAMAGETFSTVRLYAGRTFDMTYTPLTDELGQPIGAVCIASDITEQRHFTEQLVRARLEAEEASRAKEVFLANMSHEIRTPLNGIIGLTGLLSQTLLDDQQRKYLNSLNLSAENLLVIINDILDFAKLRSGRYELEHIQFSLRRILDNLQPSFQPKLRERGNRFQLVVDPALPDQLVGDPYRLNQILLNLVSNAVKFTDRGSVTVAVTALALSEGAVKLQLEVRDTGIGIPAERLPLIFDQFTPAAQYTANTYGGTGLGLSIVRQLVHNMGGQLEVESLPGSGTTFRVELSYDMPTDQRMPEVTEAPQAMPLQGQPLRILLVEDHPVNQLVAAEVLAGFHCHVTTADNGRMALDILRQETFDAVLMDIRMPEMDGYQATHLIRTELPAPARDVPIIAMTAHAFPEEREKCFQMGMNDYLSKPYNADLLLAKIVKHTRLQQAPVMATPLPMDASSLAGQTYGLHTLQHLFRGRPASIRQFLETSVEQLSEAASMLREPSRHAADDLGNTLHKLKTTFRFLEVPAAAAEAERLEMAMTTAPTDRAALEQMAMVCHTLAQALAQDPLLTAPAENLDSGASI